MPMLDQENNFLIPVTGAVTISATGVAAEEAQTYIDGASTTPWAPDDPGAVVMGAWYAEDGDSWITYMGSANAAAEYTPSLPAWQSGWSLYLLSKVTHYQRQDSTDYSNDPYVAVTEPMPWPRMSLYRSGGTPSTSSATADTFEWNGFVATLLDEGPAESNYNGLKATSGLTRARLDPTEGLVGPGDTVSERGAIGRQWTVEEVAILVVTGGTWYLPTVAPPCRLFPREDGLGVGGGRHFPPSKSQQRSGRRFGYY